MPALLGDIARSPIGFWSRPVYLCFWMNGAGVPEPVVLSSASECISAGGYLVEPGPWGYVVW